MSQTSIRFSFVSFVLLITFACFGQETAKTQVKPVKAASTLKEPAKTTKITEEQELALQVLETSEASARGLEAPMRSYSLLQIASSFPTQDDKKARALLHDSFTASLAIQDDNDTKARLQEDIFRALLPLSLDDVQKLLPQAEPKVRTHTSESIITLYADKKQFEKGLDLIDQVTAWDEFPYNSAGKLMDAMPAEMIAEKQNLFIQAVNSYKNHEHPGIRIGGALTGLILHQYKGMNPKIVMQAIEEVLSQSKNKDEKNQRAITLGGDGGTVAFSSDYEYQLFALLPIIRQFDESRAQSLLEENKSLQAMLQQFPLGMESVDPTPKEKPKEGEAGPKRTGVQTSVFSTDRANAAMSAQQYAAQEARRRMQEVMGEAEKDPVQALAHTTTLPITIGDFPMSPRGNALTAIAHASVKKNPAVASQALSELRKIVGDMPLGAQAQSLQTAANLYLELGDREGAEKSVSEGFKVADKLLEKDLNPDDPNQGLKAWWPSADAYRRFVEVQTKISRRDTVNLLKEIKDPEIRTLQSIMYARALLGLPMKRTTIVEKRKNMNRTMVTLPD